MLQRLFGYPFKTILKKAGLLPQNSGSFIFIKYDGTSPTSIVKKKNKNILSLKSSDVLFSAMGEIFQSSKYNFRVK